MLRKWLFLLKARHMLQKLQKLQGLRTHEKLLQVLQDS
jgi:hypothetical protein